MQARFPGTCRDCGNRFPAGTDIDWQKGKGASCCNGSPQVAKVDRAFIVDGAMKMEWVEEKTFQEGVAFQGDSVIYEERVYSGYNWMCVECRLVWGKQHQAINCGKRNHVPSYEDTYGVREVVNGVPTGPNMYAIIREAVRREKSKDTPPVAPAPVPQVEEPAPQADPQDEGCCAGCECGNECLPDCPTQAKQDMTSEADPFFMSEDGHEDYDPEDINQHERGIPTQDMTSHEMWESTASVTQPTITTIWN